ncbi:MAG: SPFH domain-containing protein [Anaerolineales bacterium]
MFGFQYIKATPTQFIMHYRGGKLKRSGTGLAFFYYTPSSSIVVVPVGSADVPFIFNEISADFQAITVQGQLTYRVQEAPRVASLLNYTVDGRRMKYVSEDPQKLPQRLINLLQVLVRAEVQKLPLKSAIHSTDAVATTVMSKMGQGSELAALGVEILGLAIQAIKPVPEMSRALEAEAREELLRLADQAIYDRRNSAVEQERKIKENELNTEIAVEEKKRQIRETKVEADLSVEAKEQQVRQAKLDGEIALENERKQLVAAQVENSKAEADVQAYAVEASLKPLQNLDAALLQALAVQNTDPRLMASLALKQLSENAAKIGNLNISPELFEMLMRDTPQKR